MTPDYGVSSLNLKWSPDGNLKINFASILKAGAVDSSAANWKLHQIGMLALGHEYQRKLASIIPGGYVREHENPDHWEVHKDKKRFQVSDLMQVKDQWKEFLKGIQAKILNSLNE